MTDDIASRTLVSGVTYGPANEITQINGGSYYGAYAGETRTYNSLKQLTGISTPGINSVSYAYPLTGNNGKISSQTDGISGETVTYTYDALNRLATAENSGASPSWGQGFSYDGFGNLTNTSVIQGSAPTMTASYDVNNHQGGEDANGNPSSVPMPAVGSSGAGGYDVENRLVAIGYPLNPAMYYSYDPMNHRVWRGESGGTPDEITFWSISGQKLATYQITESGSSLYCAQTGINYYFGGKLIEANNAARSGWVYSDRLGSIGKFYPYGIERPSATTNGTEKFTGYFRDAESGNDYAVNRYESPGTGRFLTADPYQTADGSDGDVEDPGSWNKYAYTEDDPVNDVDPEGLCRIPIVGSGGGGGGVGVGVGGGGGGGEEEVAELKGSCGGPPPYRGLGAIYVGGQAKAFAKKDPTPKPPRLSGAWSTIQALFNQAWNKVWDDLSKAKCAGVFGLSAASLQQKMKTASYETGYCPPAANGQVPDACTQESSPQSFDCNGQIPCITIAVEGGLGQATMQGDYNPNATATLTLGASGNNVPSATATVSMTQWLTFDLLHEIAHLVTGLSPDANNYDNPINIGILQNCIGVDVTIKN